MICPTLFQPSSSNLAWRALALEPIRGCSGLLSSGPPNPMRVPLFSGPRQRGDGLKVVRGAQKPACTKLRPVPLLTVDKKIFLAPLVGCSKYSIFKLVNLSTQLQVKICVTTSTFPIQAPQGLTAGPHDQGLKASSAMRDSIFFKKEKKKLTGGERPDAHRTLLFFVQFVFVVCSRMVMIAGRRGVDHKKRMLPLAVRMCEITSDSGDRSRHCFPEAVCTATLNITFPV